VSILSDALFKVLKDPETASKLESKAVTIKGTTPQQLQRYIESETQKWREVIDQAGIQPE
jgi:tripartite-type tricarboxylate transporter receptor subunit TctC